MWYPIVILLLSGYMLGNINGSVSISVLTRNEDVRIHGSGNAGFTNFFRSYGGKAALLVILVDGGKAVIACLVGGLLLAPYGQEKLGMALAGLAVSLGHDFPALLGFRGGKGILSGIFILIVIDWRIALCVLAVFLAAYCVTKYVSLGSVLGAVTYGIGFAVVYHKDIPVMLCGILIAALAIYMHRSNISRLIHGKETKTYFWGKKQ